MPCPSCGVEAGARCIGTRDNIRESNHQSRINRWLALKSATGPESPIEKHARAVRLNVPCPVCGAERGQHCTHPSGDVFPESHTNRLKVARSWVERRRENSLDLPNPRLLRRTPVSTRTGGSRSGAGISDVLILIADEPGITTAEIATKLAISQYFLERILPRLEIENRVQRHGTGWARAPGAREG